ncbi:hypothetical protein SBD_4838 [Streptomyces bottropensis ATCC 25435]|uniref:Uncharacterized protein n=1 Tax=Streptomyces bottropensis ATCC 25435 TaxID=1054862 RepID=M3FMI3_9ACTN|nr:hypothetical protein SBD_4838 [Streptomyces bottropensis ATCC 25435]
MTSPRPPLAAQYGAAPTRGWCSWTLVNDPATVTLSDHAAGGTPGPGL